MTKKKANPMPAGAPTKYDPKYNKLARKLCVLGATDDDLADFFEVHVDTINEWKKKHPAFSESLKKGKRVADANVAYRLYQRALGYEHDDEEIKVVTAPGQHAGSKVERVKVRKYYPPDTTAAIFFLKNRYPERWRDKQEVEWKGSAPIVGMVIDTETKKK